MAKTVKIPDNMSPWKAIINGVEYVYPAGTTQQVPDEVADFIERISKVEPEKAPVTPPFAGGGMGGADWNDKEGEPGHVLNRTHYSEIVQTEVFPEQTVEIMADIGIGAPGFPLGRGFVIKEGAQYDVWMDGTKYSCTAFSANDANFGEVVAFGNAYFVDSARPNTGEPFIAIYSAIMNVSAAVVPTGATEATFRIVEKGEVVHKLPTKYYVAAHYITVVYDGEMSGITNVNAEMLREMYASNIPMYVKFYDSTVPNTDYFLPLTVKNAVAYNFVLPADATGESTHLQVGLMEKNNGEVGVVVVKVQQT